MKETIKSFVKNNYLFYRLYYYTGTVLLKLLGLFLRTNQKSILFVTYGGKQLGDSPYALYEAICRDQRFNGYKLYWALENVENRTLHRGKLIRIDTFQYYKTALTTGVWITNTGIERGLQFKKRNTLYINTWHGTPLKKIERDAVSANIGAGVIGRTNWDLMTAQSRYDKSLFMRLFHMKSNQILMCDLPRNDYLVHYDKREAQNIKLKLGIDLSKKVILFAPTFREYKKNLKIPVHFAKWKEMLSEEYVVLFRAHYEDVKKIRLLDSEFIINVSKYNNLNELMVISDVLVTDYSSIMVDYSILERPMFCYAYDLDEYKEKRGMYIDIEKEFPNEMAFTEEVLLEQIRTMDESALIDRVICFKEKYAGNAGDATNTVLNEILEIIS